MIVEAHIILITKKTETVNNKISYLSTELAQEILSFFLWRLSNVPNSFSDHYRQDQYWENQTGLEPPRTPEHLHRFKNIDPVPRIQKTQAEIKRVLIPGTVPPRQQYWRRINPLKKHFFEDPTGPDSKTTVPPGH